MVTNTHRDHDQQPDGATREAPDRPHRVLVVDDHPVVTDSIAGLLGCVPDLEVVATAPGVAGALQRLQADEVDVVLLDLQLDGESGLDLLARLDKQRSRVPVLVFSMHPPGQCAIAALEAGARGYLTKAAPITTLAAALREVATGGSWIAPELHAILEQRTATVTTLSPREQQVLELLAAGLGTRQIADTLQLSPPTISTHKRRIHRKVGTRTAVELLRYAQQTHPHRNTGP